MRLQGLLSVVCSSLLVASAASADINGISDGSDTEAQAVSCAIENEVGTATTTLTVATQTADDSLSWIQYQSGGAPSLTVEFFTVPFFAPAPLRMQYQRFTPAAVGAATTNIVTPFAIPFWADDRTSGPYLVLVRNSLGQANFCFFTASP